MEKFSHLLAENSLFSGVPREKLGTVLECLNASQKQYGDRTLIFCSGQPGTCVGIVLEGCVEIFLAGSDGACTLLSQSGPGELFGQALAVAGASNHVFEFYASAGSRVVYLHIPEFTSLKNCHCTYRFKVMENLMKLVSQDNMNLMMKIQILTQHSLRQKLLLYFSILSKEQQSSTVTLPFGRDKLSFYLFCDRSAVSRELGRMKREGLITFTKNTVTLLPKAHLSSCAS